MKKGIMVLLLKDYGLYKSRCVLLEKEIGVMSEVNSIRCASVPEMYYQAQPVYR